MSDSRQAGRWKPGQSGNPAGKPKGTRHRTTMLAEKLLANDAGEIVGVLVAAAKNGDVGACRALLGHILAPIRERPLPMLDMPECNDADGIAKGQAAVFSAAASGLLTATEAQALAGLLELRRKSVESADFAQKLAALEKRLAP